MTMFYEDKQTKALDAMTNARAAQAKIDLPERQKTETSEEYHTRIWLALQQSAQN